MTSSWHGLVKITKSCLLLTTIKGVNRFFKADYVFIQVFWFVSIAVLFSVAVVQVNQAYSDYASHHTIVKMYDTTFNATQMSFPTVTLCNLKAVHNQGETQMITEYFLDLSENITKWYKKNGSPTHDDQTAYHKMLTTESLYEFIGNEHAQSRTQSLEDFLISCMFQGDAPGMLIPCDQVAQVKSVPSSEYFSCARVSMSASTFQEYWPRKLVIILHLNDEDNAILTEPGDIDTAFQESGAIMAVNNDKQIADFRNRGVKLLPGTATTVNMGLSMRERMQDPYGQCLPNDSDLLYFPSSGKKMSYAKMECQSACFQDQVSKYCQCYSSNTRAVFDKNQASQRYCAGKFSTFEKRMASVACALEVQGASMKRCEASCPEECTEATVSTTVSSSGWMRPSLQLPFYHRFIKNSRFAHKYSIYADIQRDYFLEGDVNKSLERLRGVGLISRNFLKVELSLSDVRVRVISDEVKTSELDFLSTLASLLNMYSGITLIVLVECLDYFLNLIAYYCCQKKEDANTDLRPAVNDLKTVTSVRL